MAYEPSIRAYLPVNRNSAMTGAHIASQMNRSILERQKFEELKRQSALEAGQKSQTQAALGGYLGGREGELATSGVSMGDIKGAQGILTTNREAAQAQIQEEEAKRTEYLARGAYDILQAPKELQAQMHDEFIAKGIQGGMLPEEASADIGQFGDDDIEEMQQLVRGGQKFGDVVPTTEQSRKAGLDERKIELEEKKFGQTVKEFDQKLKTGGLEPKEAFDRETKLRKEFTNLSGEFIKQRDAFGRVEASAVDPSAAGDLALIFNYMKVLDPGSTVREGEFATAQNSGSVPDRAIAAYNKVLAGERLSSTQRNDFVKRADKLFKSAERHHNRRTDQYKGIAKRAGVNPEQVLVELGLVQEGGSQEQAAEQSKVINGKTYIQQDGKWFEQ